LDTDSKEIGKTLRELREDRGLTLKEVADRVGTNYVHLSYIERSLRPASESLIKKALEILQPDENLRAELMKRLLFLLAREKAPEAIRESITMGGRLSTGPPGELAGRMDEEKHHYARFVPLDFKKRLEKDIAGRDLEDIAKQTGVPLENIKAVLYDRRQIRRGDIISLAVALDQSMSEYLILAGYIPDELFMLIGSQTVMHILKTLARLDLHEVALVEDVMDAIIANRKPPTVSAERGEDKAEEETVGPPDQEIEKFKETI